MQAQLAADYNYDSFVLEEIEPWLNFEGSPPLGEQAPDFPLWSLDGMETRLSEVWEKHIYTVVEFGSFT
jgi:hypothetical protein